MKKPFRDDQLASTLMSLAVASLAVTSCHSSSSASAAASSKGCWQWLPAFVTTKMKLVGHEILWPTKVWQVKKKKQYYHRIPLRSSHVGLRRKYTLYLWNGCDDCFRLLLSYTRNTTRLKTSSANWANLMIKKTKNMINQIKAVMFVQDAERKAWLGILQKQRCPVFPVTTRNRAEQAQHGRWLFKITRVGGSCAGCPWLRLSSHAVLCWERRGRQNFPNFPGRNRRAGEDFLLQLTLRGEGSREQLFTCCQDFLLWSCLESDNLDCELKN